MYGRKCAIFLNTKIFTQKIAKIFAKKVWFNAAKILVLARITIFSLTKCSKILIFQAKLLLGTHITEENEEILTFCELFLQNIIIFCLLQGVGFVKHFKETRACKDNIFLLEEMFKMFDFSWK